ncbi:MAG: SpoIIE family protein phosphatase [Bacteroidota bacterium]
MTRYFYIFLWSSLLIFLTSCGSDHTEAPVVTEAEVDLRQVDWEHTKIVDLNGEWEFYWQRLLYPKDFEETTPTDSRLVGVPSSWTEYEDPETKEKLDAYQYATYRIRFKLSTDNPEPYAIKIPFIWTASKVWLNGEIIQQGGSLGENTYGQTGGVVTKLHSFNPTQEKQELIVQVSNVNGIFIAGLVQSFKIGYETPMILEKEQISGQYLMWIGILVVMGLYHFLLYAFRPRYKATAYFGVICLIIASRVSVFGEHFLYEYFSENFRLFNGLIQPKIYYIGQFALVPLGLFYLKSLYPEEFTWRNVERNGKTYNLPLVSITVIISMICLFILIAPLGLFSQNIAFFSAFLGIGVAYLLVILFRAIYHRREDTLLQFLGILAVLLGGLNDGLHSIFGIELFGGIELLPLSFVVFLFLQFVTLARRFSRALEKAESFNEELEKEVDRQTKSLNKKTLSLEKTNQQITDSVRYASRIQRGILGDAALDTKYFRESFVFFRPRDIVSGDFYWFAECPDKMTYVVIAADCTGHGVPGAFMTVMGNDLLNEIINQEQLFSPAKILKRLDEKLEATLQRNVAGGTVRDGMDIAVVTYTKASNTLRFAGAKNPLLFIRNGKATRIKGSHHAVGGMSKRKKVEKQFEEHEFEARSGDRFYIYTDGFQDQFGGKEKRKYLSKRFRELLVDNTNAAFEEQSHILDRELGEWQGDERQTDDILVVGFKVD